MELYPQGYQKPLKHICGGEQGMCSDSCFRRVSNGEKGMMGGGEHTKRRKTHEEEC